VRPPQDASSDRKSWNMRELPAAPSAAKAVSLFRGLYARVGHNLGVDESYISRVARGERNSKIAVMAINREFRRVLALIGKSPARSSKNRSKRPSRKNVSAT